ncbi:unnamed protein product [Colias eurytheme]|nr:unnamed protein product [Colias eurytheme]
MSEQVKSITRGIEESLQAIVGGTVSGVDNNAVRSVRVDLDRFDKWTIAYTDVKESSNLFNAMFGVQITVMLVAAMVYFIIFLYGFAYISVSVMGYSQYMTLVLYSCKLLIFLVALFILSRSAQNLQNEVDALKRQLVKLLIHYPTTDVCHKATKDLLRLVTTRAVRTRSFGSVNIDMTLIPYSVMFFTSYTVITLQLNNVV